MSNKNKLKEAFDAEAIHGPFFTGGSVSWTDDGNYFYCENDASIELVSIEKSLSILTIGETNNADEIIEDDRINTFAVSIDGEQVVTSNKSGLIKNWGAKDGLLKKVWKSIHKGPISKLVFHKSGSLLASGGCDGVVRIWNLQDYTCTEALLGAQGVISVLEFHPDDTKNIIFAAGDDCKIHAWHVESRAKVMTLHGHFSKVTSLSFSEDFKYMVSSGRDSVICFWNIESGKLEKTHPVYEAVEGAIILPVDSKLPSSLGKPTKYLHVAIVGAAGIVRIFDAFSGKELYKQENSLITPATEETNLSVTQLLYNKEKNALSVVTVDHNIFIYDLQSFDIIKQLIGYCDEILDVVYFGKRDSHMAVATNSNDIKIYDITSMNCSLLKGHTDLVLSLDKSRVNPNLLISGSKDNTIRLWLMNPETQKIRCVAIGARHTASVGSVCLNHTSLNSCFSVSQDQCLKLWKMPESLDSSDVVNLTCTHTELAHKKDINCVAISPNDKFIATGSQDKSAKLWSADDLSLLGVFKGHKRGVWCVKFSPVDQVLVSTSADCSIKLWCLNELYCLKTIDAHGSSVLRVDFIANGTQIVTTGADGLIKVWSLKTSESTVTLEQHDGRIWALAVSADENGILSGGADSKLIMWKDVSDEKREKEAKERQEIIEQEQKMSNLLQNKQYLKALKIAIRLDRPMQALSIIKKVIGTPDKMQLSETIHGLKPAHKEALFNYAIQWNTNTRNCHAAQQVLNVLLMDLQTDFKPSGLQGMLESAMPYTERHFSRLTQLMQDLHFINYMVNTMEPHAQEQIMPMEE